MRLPKGKVPPTTLKEIVFNYLGSKHQNVILGPSYGLDGAVIRIGEHLLISSMDPITGALKRLGWLAININANDVATFGVKPAYFSSCLLLPEKSTEDTVRTICRQIDCGAQQLGIAIVGGHSETTANLPFPIVVGSCMGITKEGGYVTARNAEADNLLLLTKSVGLEGTAILATDRYSQLLEPLGKATLEKAESMFSLISVVKEAVLAFETGHVTAMHDPTEGGVAGGLHELADACGLGFRIYEEKLRVAEETHKICRFFRIDPLQLIASGSLLIAVKKGCAYDVERILKKNKFAVSIIGELLSSSKRRVIVTKGGAERNLERPASDHLWRALAK